MDPPLRRRFPVRGWLGLVLIAVFWPINWALTGPRTYWAFFPLWLGFCLGIDAINFHRRGTSLWTRSPRLYLALFVISIPLWWTFEAINRRTGNWIYVGGELFGGLEYAFWASLSFSTVAPAVLGCAELIAGLAFMDRFRRGPSFAPHTRRVRVVFLSGVVTLALIMAWPDYFFPFVWLSLFFVLEPVNIWLGHRSLMEPTGRGDWRPIVALCLGVLICGFFWEMWNFYSYPKWIYRVPWFGFWHVFEMPFLGYLGYLPFSLEVFAMVHLALGLAGKQDTDYVVLGLAQDRAGRSAGR